MRHGRVSSPALTAAVNYAGLHHTEERKEK